MLTVIFSSCKKDTSPVTPASPYKYIGVTVDGLSNGTDYNNVRINPVVRITFSDAVNQSSINGSVSIKDDKGIDIGFQSGLENENKTVVIQPLAFAAFSKYVIGVNNSLTSSDGRKLGGQVSITLSTGLDSTDKFPRISDDDLLTLVQRQTFKYFWDFGHPVSGMARERDSSGDIVTTGGTGFGVMAIVTAINRNFIPRQEGLERVQKIVSFLKTRAQRFHGAFPHWLNGSTGAVQPFSAKDNGADLVETSFLMEGLLTARQYFNGTGSAETGLRGDINELWQAVEWSWFRKGNENVLYWHWSPDYNWDMNMPVQGWNEALITYVLSASSPSYPIPKAVYDNGWAGNGTIRNGNVYYGVQLPLGTANGGPLFFAHYSFMGINPNGLSDAYADYGAQNRAHTLINYQYCKTNPKGYYGYSSDCWGLTASDDINGYLAHSPANDNGVVSPTAALSSFPYTPAESMQALKFFYYKLGDRIWKDYGFIDAFSLQDAWFSNSFLAIDQGPVIVMIENYRSNLIWNLFMSCPEIKSGLRSLGFSGSAL